jgi:Cd2+/Zn2+-exporting ATPase
MVAALSAAARLGILIKNVADIELAATINAFVFDKTGTLTTGKLAVSRLHPLGDTAPAELLRIAASAEKYSNHPTAKAPAHLRTKPASRCSTKTSPRRPGNQAQLNGDDFRGRADWLKDNGITEALFKSVDLNETEGFSLFLSGATPPHRLGWLRSNLPRGEALAEQAERRAPHRDGFGRSPAGCRAGCLRDRLRRSGGRVFAAEQSSVCASDEGQGLSGCRGRRRRE